MWSAGGGGRGGGRGGGGGGDDDERIRFCGFLSNLLFGLLFGL